VNSVYPGGGVVDKLGFAIMVTAPPLSIV